MRHAPRAMPDAPPPRDREGALLVAYANGDAGAARDLTASLAPRALAVAARMLGDRAEAEDVTQEAMLRLWRVAPAWRQGEARVATWLHRVVSNLCLDRIRQRRGVGLEEVAEPADPAPSVAERMAGDERVAALHAAIGRLPERQRLAVSLRHLDGLSNPEVAAVMDIGVEAVESLTARGRRALATILSGRKEELGHDG